MSITLFFVLSAVLSAFVLVGLFGYERFPLHGE